MFLRTYSRSHFHIVEITSPFDLNVLCTPPAFILSQDRTLILNVKAEAFKFFPIQNSLSFVLSVVLLRINSHDLFDRLTIAGL